MTQIVWNAVGERVFEAGVDHGVLYVDGLNGVPWNGLVSVSESPTGGDSKSYYLDGIKYLIQAANEEFEATVEAYTYPEEFAACDGTLSIANGLSVTQQARKPFALSYRTRIGNDVDGVDHGYKIHLVYNAMADPSDRQHDSITDSIEPFHFSWHIVTKPPSFTGYKPTSHFVVDSRETPVDVIKELNDILYGTVSSEPRMPSITELLYLFTEFAPSIFDAGFLTEDYFGVEFDGGLTPTTLQDATIDGGTP